MAFPVVEAIAEMEKGHIKTFFALGGNFASATPDTPRIATALAKCKITAHVSTKLNRSHLEHGDIGLILPCLGRSERDVQSGKPMFVVFRCER